VHTVTPSVLGLLSLPQLFKEWNKMDVEAMKTWIKENAGVEYDTSKYGAYEKLAKAEEEEQKMAGEEGQSEEPKDDSNDNVKVSGLQVL
jgi:cysteinyl-tRNA synthetase